MTSKKLKFGNSAGFTLIETLVSIFIFSILILLINNFIISSYRTYGYINEEAKAIDEARRGIEIMTKEILKSAYKSTTSCIAKPSV